jgi:hypothetical protein
MTAAFEKFMKQYKMTGSEKADGYSRDAFIGLDEREKEAVFELLVTELPWEVEWLFFLNPEKALVVAKNLEEKLRGNMYGRTFMLQEQLVRYTGDLLYQKHMIEDYPTYAESLRPLVVDSIGRTPTNEATIGFFKQVIMVDADASAVDRASRRLLESMKVPRATAADEDTYRRLVGELRSDKVQVKLNAIARIDKYKAISPRDT